MQTSVASSQRPGASIALWSVVTTLLLLLPLTAIAGEEGKKPANDKKQQQQKEEAKERELLRGLGTQENPYKKLLGEISHNMKNIEDLLNRKQTGSETQQLQSQTIDKIEKLIEVVEKNTSSCETTGQSSSSKPEQSKEDQKRSEEQQKLHEKQQQQQKKELGGQHEPENPGKTRNDRTSKGKMPPVKQGELHPRNGVEGRWGRLPGKVLEQMYDNGQRKLPERYRMLLEEYFRRLPLPDKK